MRLKNNRSGFTLLEIIIVIIIVGVLASLALPRLFNTIEYSRSTEALNVIGTIKRAADRCDMALEATGGASDNYLGCDTLAEIGVDDPGAVPSAVFTYGITAYATPNYQVVATRDALPDGTTPTITFTYNTTNGATTRAGTGPYSGLK
jgi:prepilin-type N-terminal cleavage/methylation domain-containing protein